jgi:hypothetical protein
MATEDDFSNLVSIDATAANKPPATAASIMDIIHSQSKQVFSNQTNKKSSDGAGLMG